MTETEHIFERLRSGTVPERGLDKFAVGIDRQLTEIRRQLDIARSGEGAFKFFRGGYGCGKTFMSQYTLIEALERNFAVSFVVVSPNDTQFHKFDDVYHKIVSGLRTPTALGGALEDSVDRWIAKIEDRLADEIGEDDPGFDEAVKARFESELSELSRSDTGVEFINVLKAFFDAKMEEDYATASSLIGWISGSKNIAATAKRKAGIKGEISSASALLYLKGVLNIIRKAGYAGLVVVIDELETILRTRSDVRAKSLNGLRQIIDASKDFHGLLWVFTGTEVFFDSRKGVAGLEPLHDRIRFTESGGFVSPKQAQLQLNPFDRDRLLAVALKLREVYPSRSPERLRRLVDDEFLQRLAEEVTDGLRGDVGVVPRQFLRELITVMDLVEENDGSDGGAEYIPKEVYRFEGPTFSAPESGSGGLADDPDDSNDTDDRASMIEF